MRSGSWSKVLWMAALLPLFAASVLPAHLRTLICRVTGAVMEVESCCPAAPAAQGQTAVGSSETGSEGISDLGCCAVETIDLGGLLAEHRTEGAASSSFSLLSATPIGAVVVVVSPRASSVRQDRPPPVGPPLLLVKRSFLI